MVQGRNKLTYGESVNEMNQRSRLFHEEMGIGYNDKYSIFMNNRIEYLTNWIGGVNIGAAPGMLHFKRTGIFVAEYTYLVQNQPKISIDFVHEHIVARSITVTYSVNWLLVRFL